MDRSAFEATLGAKIGQMFGRHPELFDHHDRFPGLTNGLGDPFSPVWFIAEFPSLGRLEHENFVVTVSEAQWSVSPGDKLFRSALVEAGLKVGEPQAAGGWRCYITNLIKEAEHAAHRRQAKTDRDLEADAKLWAPVLRWQLDAGRPKVVVLMGARLARLAAQLEEDGLIVLPRVERIESYVYVASRPAGKLGPMHPARVAAYKGRIAEIAASVV